MKRKKKNDVIDLEETQLFLSFFLFQSHSHSNELPYDSCHMKHPYYLNIKLFK